MDLAKEAATTFLDGASALPGIETKLTIEEGAGEVWLTLWQIGDIVTGEEPLFPDYERVEVSDE